MAKPSFHDAGLHLRRTVAALAWSFGLLAGLGFSSASARAQEPLSTLTPEAIAAFELKLVQATAAQKAVADRLVCFEEQDKAWVQRRDTDQKRLGELILTKRTIQTRLSQQKSDYDDLERDVAAANQRLQGLREELSRQTQYKADKEEALRRCKADRWTPNIACDLAYGLAHLMGAMKNNEQQIQTVQGEVDGAETSMSAALTRYQDGQKALADSERDLGDANEDIRTAENSIRHLQSSLSILRPVVFDNKTLLDDFAFALTEANKVNTADDRARTARKVRDLAERVDASMQRSNTLSAETKATLVQQQLTSCFQ